MNFEKESKQDAENKVPLKPIKVLRADFLKDYTLLVTFSDHTEKVIDVGPALQKYARGYFKKYLSPSGFKKFHIENGSVAWGKEADIVLPAHQLYQSS